MKVYFKNKLGVTTTVELEKNNTIEEFVSKIQDNGGIVFSGLYFPVSLRIQSKCEKIRTRKNSVFGHISQSEPI